MSAIEPTLFDQFDDLREAGAISDLGLDPRALRGMTYERWEALGVYLGRLHSSTRWAIGDWLLFGETSSGFEDRVSQAMHVTGLRRSTLESYRWVASAIVRKRRRPGLSWSHHETVASASPQMQKKLLDRAEREGLTVEQLRDARRDEEREERPPIEGAEPPERVTVKDAAHRVWITAQRDGDAYRVPVETMLSLARALGEAPA